MSEGVNIWAKAKQDHRPVHQSVRVPMRGDLLAEIGRLEAEAQQAAAIDQVENRDPVAPALAERILQLQDELRASEVEFVFHGIGRKAKAELEREHPPTPEQQTKAEEDGLKLLWNGDTFPPALLAASCVAPEGFDLEAATEVWDEWSEGQAKPLWQACLVANVAGSDVGPKSPIASAILHGSAKNSTTAPR